MKDISNNIESIYNTCWYYYEPELRRSLVDISDKEHSFIQVKQITLFEAFFFLFSETDYHGAMTLLMGIHNPAPVVFFLLAYRNSLLHGELPSFMLATLLCDDYYLFQLLRFSSKHELRNMLNQFDEEYEGMEVFGQLKLYLAGEKIHFSNSADFEPFREEVDYEA